MVSTNNVWRECFINALPLGGHLPQGLKPAFCWALNGTLRLRPWQVLKPCPTQNRFTEHALAKITDSNNKKIATPCQDNQNWQPSLHAPNLVPSHPRTLPVMI